MFPAFLLHNDNLAAFYAKEIAEDFSANREKTMSILQEESKLEEIVRLVGTESLSPKEQLTLEIARMIREDFLFQNAFDPADAYTSLKKQYRILRAILMFLENALAVIEQEDFEFGKLQELPVKEEIAQAHLIPEEELEKFDALEKEIQKQISALKS